MGFSMSSGNSFASSSSLSDQKVPSVNEGRSKKARTCRASTIDIKMRGIAARELSGLSDSLKKRDQEKRREKSHYPHIPVSRISNDSQTDENKLAKEQVAPRQKRSRAALPLEPLNENEECDRFAQERTTRKSVNSGMVDPALLGCYKRDYGSIGIEKNKKASTATTEPRQSFASSARKKAHPIETDPAVYDLVDEVFDSKPATPLGPFYDGSTPFAQTPPPESAACDGLADDGLDRVEESQSLTPWTPTTKKQLESEPGIINTPRTYSSQVSKARQLINSQESQLSLPCKDFKSAIEEFGSTWKEVQDLVLNYQPLNVILKREQAKQNSCAAANFKQSPDHTAVTHLRARHLENKNPSPIKGAWSPGFGIVSGFTKFLRKKHKITAGRNISIVIARDLDKRLIYTVAATDGPPGGIHAELSAWDALPASIKELGRGVIFTERAPCHLCTAKLKENLPNCQVVFSRAVSGRKKYFYQFFSQETLDQVKEKVTEHIPFRRAALFPEDNAANSSGKETFSQLSLTASPDERSCSVVKHLPLQFIDMGSSKLEKMAGSSEEKSYCTCHLFSKAQ